jgi:hypothetical protein
MREYVRFLDRGADSLPLPYDKQETFDAMLALLDRYFCAKCRLTPENTVPEPCDQCVTGRLGGRIRELEAEFHYDWARDQMVGRCGHRWRPLGLEADCPFCELLAKGRPKRIVRRAVDSL